MNTCSTCRHYRPREEEGVMCARTPHVVTGEPIRLCSTERLVNVATVINPIDLGVCGKEGRFHEPKTPRPKTSMRSLARDFVEFWSFWKS